MTDFYARLGDLRVTTAYVRVPNGGVWFANAELDTDVAPTGAVVLTLGDLELHGVIDPKGTGTFRSTTRVRIIGGAGGWQKTIAKLPHHSDAGVKRSTVARGAALAAGETLTVQAAFDGTVGSSFTRQAAPASRILEQLFPSVLWWVGFDGTTTVGVRPGGTVAAEYQLVAPYDPRERRAVLATETLAAFAPGVTLDDERFEAPVVVRELAIEASAKGTQLHVGVA